LSRQGAVHFGERRRIHELPRSREFHALKIQCSVEGSGGRLVLLNRSTFALGANLLVTLPTQGSRSLQRTRPAPRRGLQRYSHVVVNGSGPASLPISQGDLAVVDHHLAQRESVLSWRRRPRGSSAQRRKVPLAFPVPDEFDHWAL